MQSPSEQLFRQVARRQRLASLGTWFFRLTVFFAVVYGVLLVLGRLLSLIPDVFELWTVSLVPAAALLGALVVHRGIGRSEAARLVDVRMDTKDLYLTAAHLESSPGEYQALIAQSAREQAGSIRPEVVVPYNGLNRAGIATLSVAVLALGAWLLPSLDPFNTKEVKVRQEQRIAKLEKEKEIAREKIEVIKQQDVQAEKSKEVEQALAKLKKEFEQMKKNEREKNLARLNEQQKQISDKWREAQEKKLKDTTRDKFAQQLGGAAATTKTQEWKKEMEQGKTESLKKELEAIKQLAEKAENEQTEVERNAAKQEMQQRMQEMQQFAQDQAGGKQMSESLQKAMEQLAQSGDSATKEPAMEALKESMNLTEQQMEQLSQAIRDQKSLQEALEAIQQARQANNQGELDGQECKDSQSLREFAEKLRQRSGNGSGDGSASEEGDGQGGGKGDKKDGQARGGKSDPNGGGQGGKEAGNQAGGDGAPADDVSGSTAFRSEKSKSALQAGKSILQWKTQEVTEPGDAKVKYREAVEKVKQGVGEAILQEEIPPGYHETIQKYFDEVGKAEQSK